MQREKPCPILEPEKDKNKDTDFEYMWTFVHTLFYTK